jgi:hypothetical protein
MTFRIRRVLGTTLRLWGKNAVPAVLITSLLHAPLILWTLSAIPDDIQIRELTLVEFTTGFIALPINVLVSALLAPGVVAELQGRPLSFGGWLKGSVTQFVTAVLTTILVSMCIGGITVIIAIPFVMLSNAAVIVGALSMLYVVGLWYAAGPACAVEGTGSLAALGRGRALAKGHRLAIVSLLLLWWIVARGLWLVVVLTLGQWGVPDHVGSYIFFDAIREVLVGSLGGVMAGVTYNLLRTEKEGASPQQLATVFE